MCSIILQENAEETAILILLELALALSPATAGCERSISLMNLVKTKLRTSMHQNTLIF